MIKCIIFDFDGVMLNSVNIKGEAFYDLLKGTCSKLQKILENYHYVNLFISRYKKINFILNNYIKEELGNKKKYIDMVENIIFKKIKNLNFFYCVKSFLNNYYKNKLFFISSSTHTRKLSKILTYTNISKFFIEAFGSLESEITHVNIFKKKYKLKNNNIFFIGVAINDYKASNNYILQFVEAINKYENFDIFIYKINSSYNFENYFNYNFKSK